MSSGSRIPLSQRKRKYLGAVTIAPDVLAALDRRCHERGDKSRIVEAALRAWLKVTDLNKPF